MADRVRCEGSITLPTETSESRGRAAGKCGTCGGWLLLLKSGLVKDHSVPAPLVDLDREIASALRDGDLAAAEDLLLNGAGGPEPRGILG